MRTSTLLVLSLSTAATLVTAEKEGGGGGGGGGGALQALLERMQTKKQQNQARALGAGHAAVRPPPEDYSNGTDSHNSTSSAPPHSNKSHPKSTKDSSSSSAKSDSASTKHGKKVHHDRPAPSAIESSAKSRLRSSDSARRPLASDKKSKTQASSTSALEKELHIVESGGRLPQGVRTHGENAEIKTASAGKAAAATDKLEKRVPEKTVKSFGKKEELKKPEDKRWVWGTAIIQDDTPAASNVPAVGENANYLNSAPANTPTATLAAPSFPPLANDLPSPQSAAALQSKVASRQKMSDRKKAAQAPAAAVKEKRWTWGNEIIQDGDENAPPVGENANLLSKGTTIAMNTPVAQLTPPSFPPLADATTSAEPATETFEALESNEGADEGEGAEAGAQVVEQASSTLSAVAAEMTSGTPDIEALLNKLQEEINALANAYSQVTQGGDVVDAAAETSPVENAKRWVWGPSIIQDDTPASAAPPIGQNANLLNPAIPVETPSNKPLAPSFPARVGLATAPVSLASINNLAAAAPASSAPVTPPVSVPAEIDTAADSTSTTTSRMNRKSQADSIRSARAAALKTRSAAMEWHLVNKKRQVGGMAKQHKRA